MGSRLNGRPRAIHQVVEAAARYCDVISVNFYNYSTPNEQITDPLKWGVWIHDKPCMITEFHVKAVEPSGKDLQSGAGFMVQTQKDRGVFYQSTCIEALQSRFYVGWQYFRYMDDASAEVVSNKGIVTPEGQVWPELAEAMKELNTQAYALIDYFDKRLYPFVETKEVILRPIDDTFVNFAKNRSEECHGLDDTLVIANIRTPGGLREAFLRFNLGTYKDSLSRLEQATICLTDASGQQVYRNMKIFGVNKTFWDEKVLNASSLEGSTDWTSSFGELCNKECTLTVEAPNFNLNVTNWLKSLASETELVTFRVIDNSSDLTPSVWFSDENSVKGPTLILKLRTNTGTGLKDKYILSQDVKAVLNDGQLLITGLNTPTNCSIYDFTGKRIYCGTVDSASIVPVTLPKGIYLIKIKNNKQFVHLKVI